MPRWVVFVLFLFTVSRLDEQMVSDSPQRVSLVLAGGGEEGVCLGKQPAESNAFRQRWVCIVGKPADLVG